MFGERVVMIIFLVLLFSTVARNSTIDEDIEKPIQLEAEAGTTAVMPCDIKALDGNDRAYMVLWYRKIGGIPLYSFDTRGREFQNAVHWSDPKVFGERAYFSAEPPPAVLRVSTVQLGDAGIYRCRVDFRNSPTRNFVMKLNIVASPFYVGVTIKNSGTNSIVGGPLNLGQNYRAICEVLGGHPTPTVEWWFNGEIVQRGNLTEEGGKMVNILSLNNAQRSWHNATLQCQTVSSPLLHPSTRVLRIRMEVPPESTRIINKDVKLLGGVPVNLTCVSKGSHPAAMISWYRDNRLYAPQAIFDYADDIHTVTTITIIPSAHDNGAIMKCSALNSILGQNLDDSFQMTVAHKPVLQLALGSSLNPDDIKEGDDVYFDCGVKSNPRENRVSWFHDGKTVHMNQSFGIIINQRSLVLQKVRRTAIGLYTCRVANDLGVTTSEPVYLRVKHEPMCTEVDPVKVGAQKNETFVVRCRVTADPPAYKFKWTIQSSDEETLLTPVTNAMVYKISNDSNYGTMRCTAWNDIGQMRAPCVIFVHPIGLPEAPRNCTFNVTKVPQPRLTVKCFAGKSNYMPQHFTIEAFGRERRLLFNDSKIYNVTNRVKDTEVSLVVDWSILGTLTRDEVLGVVARNSMGPSEPTFLYNLSYDDIVPEPGPTPSLFSSLEIVMMAVATVILLLIAISLPSLYKQRAPAAAEIVAMNEIDGDENDDNPDIPEGGPENDDHLEIPEGSHQNGPVEVNNITFPRTKSNGSRIFDMNEIDLASRNDITPPSPAPPDPPNALILNESIRIFHLPERKNIYENILADKIDETIV